jgi:NDP-sugar pyrophosphorylase family protein
MKAMIFAAGLGTRLKPLTDSKPKALVEIGGMSLLEIQIRRLHRHGIRDIVVNVHHHPNLMRHFLETFNLPGLTLHLSDETTVLLDTGGGLHKALEFWSDDTPVFVCNVDVLTDLDPHQLLNRHQESRAQATLGLLSRNTSRLLTFDQNMQLTGWKNCDTGAKKGHPSAEDNTLAFCGLQIVQPSFLRKYSQPGVYSVIDLYLQTMDEERILGVDLQGIVWMDVGKPAELLAGEALMSQVLPGFNPS